MKLAKLELRGVRGVPDVDVDLSPGGPVPSDLFLVTGAPASGKTRLLEAVLAALEVIGPYEGMVRASSWIRKEGTAATITLKLLFDASERERLETDEMTSDVRVWFRANGVEHDASRGVARLIGDYAHDDAIGKREYFAETRQLSWGARVDRLGALEQSLMRSSKSPFKYSFMPRFLSSLSTDPVALTRVGAALAKLSPSLRVDASDASLRNHGRPVALSELASSEADALILAATASMVRLSRSIVFLDRPELYVPPERIVAWARSLSTLGADNQWIVATASPELLRAIPRTEVHGLE